MNAAPSAWTPRWRALAIGIGVAVVVWAAWLGVLGVERAASLLASQWPVTLTMVFGSFIAGATSEGGGAVAFPVFTKALGVSPGDARLFALAIQSVGMTAAAAVIIAMRVRVDWRAIGWATAGGVVGLSASLIWIAPVAPPAEVRMLFTALQAGFAVVLLVAMRRDGARAQGARMPTRLAPACLVVAGVGGGLASGLVGSGIDLVVFSALVLLFRMSEKVATPTSVVLMAVHSLLAMAVYALRFGPLPERVMEMWLAAVPIVVIGAPVGAWVCSHLRRQTIAWTLVALIGVEVLTTLWLVPLTGSVVAVGLGALGCFFGLFVVMLRCKVFDPTSLRSRRQSELAEARDAVGLAAGAIRTPR